MSISIHSAFFQARSSLQSISQSKTVNNAYLGQVLQEFFLKEMALQEQSSENIIHYLSNAGREKP